MFKLTCITLEDGVCALYINGQYLGADDCSDERFSLGDILERLSRLPGVSVETATRPVPQNADWSWDEVAGSVFESGSPARKMTVSAFKQRLAGYPDAALFGLLTISWRWMTHSTKTLSMRRWRTRCLLL